MSRVPPGTTLLWRDPGIWEEYRGWILAALTLVLLQTALIAGLLAERRRRLASQRQLAERLGVQALVADISTGFANLSGDRLDAQIVSSLERLGRALDTEDCAIWALRGPDGRPRRMFGWPEKIDGASEGSLLEESLLTWARPRLDQGEEVQIGDITDRPIRSAHRAGALQCLVPATPLAGGRRSDRRARTQPRVLAGLVRPCPRRPAHDRRDHRHRVGAQADRCVDAPAARNAGPRQSCRQPGRTGRIDRARVEPAARGHPEQRGSRAAVAGPARSAVATNCARSSAT